eukprot:6961814-Pyramimonas_sp.AAC.1
MVHGNVIHGSTTAAALGSEASGLHHKNNATCKSGEIEEDSAALKDGRPVRGLNCWHLAKWVHFREGRLLVVASPHVDVDAFKLDALL